MVGEDLFGHPFSITPLPFTITCPNVTFPKLTTSIHESNLRTKTPTFWKAAATCPQQMSVLLHMSTLYLCTTISASNPLRTCITQVAARKQHPCPSNTRRCFRQFLVIYHCLDKGGGG